MNAYTVYAVTAEGEAVDEIVHHDCSVTDLSWDWGDDYEPAPLDLLWLFRDMDDESSLDKIPHCELEAVYVDLVGRAFAQAYDFKLIMSLMNDVIFGKHVLNVRGLVKVQITRLSEPEFIRLTNSLAELIR